MPAGLQGAQRMDVDNASHRVDHCSIPDSLGRQIFDPSATLGLPGRFCSLTLGLAGSPEPASRRAAGLLAVSLGPIAAGQTGCKLQEAGEQG